MNIYSSFIYNHQKPEAAKIISIGEWYLHTMECYGGLKRNKFFGTDYLSGLGQVTSMSFGFSHLENGDNKLMMLMLGLSEII